MDTDSLCNAFLLLLSSKIRLHIDLNSFWAEYFQPHSPTRISPKPLSHRLILSLSSASSSFLLNGNNIDLEGGLQGLNDIMSVQHLVRTYGTCQAQMPHLSCLLMTLIIN